MPYLEHSGYTPPFWLPSGHLQTIFPAIFRKRPTLALQRVFLPTPDGDRIALDIAQAGATRSERGAAVLSHGLEGDSRRRYILGMARAFVDNGVDVVARNFRCCGGEMNLLPGMYHSGQTEDLHTTVRYCLELGYTRIVLVGFSMGGNQVLKYLGEDPDRVPEEVVAAAAFSVPCDLTGSARTLDKPSNRIYMEYFLRSLRQKIRAKHIAFPALYPLKKLGRVRTFREFDDRYTAPVHGFTSAADYWEKSSCLPHLATIRTPALLVNAGNDPFLSSSCYPVDTARHSKALFFEVPGQGGHVGFVPSNGSGRYWSELRALEFFERWL